MKAISIKQPWASLIAHGIKDMKKIELLFYFCVFFI
jgi:hypothetical protein